MSAFVFLKGHLGRDPECTELEGGIPVFYLNIAVKIRDKNNNVSWWKVSLWGERYRNSVKLLKKGSSVLICGILYYAGAFMKKDGTPGISLQLNAKYMEILSSGKSILQDEELQGEVLYSQSSSELDLDDLMASAGEKPEPSSGDKIFATNETPFL